MPNTRSRDHFNVGHEGVRDVGQALPDAEWDERVRANKW
jgi:hypothetical protein